MNSVHRAGILPRRAKTGERILLALDERGEPSFLSMRMLSLWEEVLLYDGDLVEIKNIPNWTDGFSDLNDAELASISGATFRICRFDDRHFDMSLLASVGVTSIVLRAPVEEMTSPDFDPMALVPLSVEG